MSKNKTPKRFNSAKEAIKYHEGFKDTAYPDGKTKQGKQLYSIGYGFNDSGAKPNIASRYLEARKSMSQEYADRLLDDYILELKGTLSQYLGYERYKGLTEGQLIAFLDTGYQNPAAMKRAATLYKKGDKEGAANALRVEGFEERNENRRAAFLDKYSPRINNTSLIDPSMSIYDALRQAGVRFNTGNPSGYRTKEQHSRFSSGENSWHRHLREDGKTAWALDITPDFSRGATWETLQYELTQNGLPEYFAANGLAILDETDPAIKKRTGATGDHYHIGKDRIAHKKGTYKDWVTKYSGQGNKYNGYTEGASGGYNPYVNYGDQAEQESPDSPRNNDNNKTFYEYIHTQNNGGNTQVSSSKQGENRNIFSDIRKLNAPTQNTEAKNDLFKPTEEDSPYVAEYKETAQKSKNTYDAVKALSHNLNLVNALNNIIEKQEQEAQLEQQSLLPMEWLTNQDSTITAYSGNLFESGGPKGKQGKVYRKLNEQDLERNGWSWGASNNVREKDPLYEDVKERFRPDENILFDSNGMAVPKSSVYKYLDYEGQLPYQPAQDINDEIRLAKVKSRLKPIGETLKEEHPIIASVLNVPTAIKNIIDARNDYNLSRDIMRSANNAQAPNWRPAGFSRPSQFLILPELINVVAYPSYSPIPNNPAESTFLLSDENARDKAFLDAGYTGKNFSDYGLVSKAVNGRNLPVWQVAKDAIPRDSLTVLGNVDDSAFIDRDKFLPDAGGYFPSAIYADKKGHLYQKIWDLNDYGGTGGATSGILGDALDAIGHPVVLTTGFQRIPWEAEGAAVSSLKNIPNNYKTHKIIKDIQSKYFETPENYKNLGGNLHGWGDFLDSAVQFVKQHPLVQKVKSGINQVVDEVNKEKANREEVGNKVLKTIGRNSIPTITEYLNQQEPHKIPNEFRTNVVNGEVPLTPSNLEFYLATAASTPARQLIKSAYNTSIPYVQKGLQTLGEMLTPSTYLKGFDPVVKGLADVIPIAGLGANSIESMQRVGANPENVAGLTLALSPLVSGAKGFRETANAFKDAINNTRWMQTRNLAKSLNQDIIDSNLGFVSPITGTNTIRLRQAPWKAYNTERGSKLTEAEKLGIPRGERKDYHSVEEDKAFKQQIIDFANKWGYDISDIPKGANTKELERYARDLIRKHNSYYRGVELPTLEEDKQLIAKALGSNASADDILKYVSTHPRPNDVLFMSPGVNAVSYGSNGKVSIISRPYSLSNDRTKWFNDGEFTISTGFNPALGSVNDPWASNIYTYANDYIPSELVSKTPMIFRRFLSPLEINEVPILSRNRYMNLPQYPFRDGGILKKVYGSNANFANRLKDKNRAFIPDWEDPVRIATHKLSVGQYGNFGEKTMIYPEVQEVNGSLVDFSSPVFPQGAGIDNAIRTGDYVDMGGFDTFYDALNFTKNYKKYFPRFDKK